ncbi:MAG: hypothetical protein M5T61_20075 [Acidimicrobiia bacterium]|nr:hypothetical protein [Acidimicrobiia bacterium]
MRIRQRLHLTDIDDLILTAPPELRRRLGLVRRDGKPYTYRQYWGFFHLVVESLDPTGTSTAISARRRSTPQAAKTFTDEETSEREAALQHVFHLICKASIPTWMRHDSGDYVGDGTTKWAYSRPSSTSCNARPATTAETWSRSQTSSRTTRCGGGLRRRRPPRTQATNRGEQARPDATYLGLKTPQARVRLHAASRVRVGTICRCSSRPDGSPP